ncbi:MAG: ion transporter [Bacteroidetes bacterium HGW-Bacteroidetes-1]|nr:MAG: ion transporter [Bacteroidetes bacterium HGW-Bacteroidetes-1]
MEKENWKKKWYIIIFQHHTRKGRLFDEILLILIVLSVGVVFLDSMKNLHDQYTTLFFLLEWGFTLIFSAEYIIRIIISPNKYKYIFSYYGIIDLISIIPTYVSIFLIGSQYLIIIRILRLLRVFRILKLVRFTSASLYLIHALKHAREKIIVFFGAVLIIVTIVGTIMYLVEGSETGFDSIPTSIYWAIVTITTVGFGDITPNTAFGQFIASLLMLVGYAIIAVPTGIITSEMAMTRKASKKEDANIECKACGNQENQQTALFCNNCGSKL